ncbi:hypothetical protein Acid345_2771 [Candidatus Koribacter versatilis Ellin345]|uniref:Uncharacterized protein n=1 Tax=Koribacter versatilis (strain Ellin345) TaxID=204669 RepID=Q1IMX8_KORVE|nr:hypothetical protein [Candidatus Koribacter versatilis]ABF41772.1 hypothetical protein Acid345_2771 [Candidatus Koribacter versatilis Ellin345]
MRNLLALSIAALLFFVLVCPFTPTPIAVVRGNAHTAPVIFLFLLPTLALPLLLASLACVAIASLEVPAFRSAVVDLTCTRLC